MSGAKATANIFVALHAAADGSAPEWINLLPAGKIETQDGRGPYTVNDMAALAAQSLAAAGGKLPVDENHATDFAAPKGAPSPALGWIVELQARNDGLWGRVQWGKAGQALIADHAYRGISPVFEHDKNNRVLRVLRASLTNTPNLRNLVSLHAEGVDMEELLKKLRTLLGLPDDAENDAIYSAVSAVMSAAAADKAKAASGTAAQSQIARALGLKEDAETALVVHTATSLAATQGKDGDARVTALQSELTNVTTQFTALQSQVARDRATAFVDAKIAEGRIGVKPLREHYIEQHAKDPARVEKELNAFAKVDPGPLPPRGATHSAGADADPVAIAAQARAYQKKMSDQGQVVDIAAAVHAVTQQQEQKQ